MAPLTEWAERFPDRAAVVGPHGHRTFAELDGNANRVARALHRGGLRPGDAAALMCGNRPELVEVVHGCQRAGLRLTPINWHLTGDEAAYIVDDCEARVLIADLPRAGVARGARAAAPRCEHALVIGGEAEGFGSYEAAVAAESPAPLDEPGRGTTMLYTSGTTGRPKGVFRSAPVPVGRPGSLTGLMGYSDDGGDVHLCTGPLYHAAPLAFSLTVPLWCGATVVLMERWDAEEALRLVEQHRVTHTHMVPTMFHRLLSLPEEVRARYDVSSLRHVLHGAAPCPPSVKRRMIEWLGPVIWEYYAATEGASGTFVDSATWLQRPGTVGKPLVEGAVVVGDEEGNPLPARELGLVWLRAEGAARFAYFKDEEKTAASFRGEYYTLGDVGYLDEDGYLYLTDRSANLIISGGVNIYPAEVDAVLLEHPAVGDVATIGVPDPEWGEMVLAVVEPQPGVAPSDDLAGELISFCRERIAHYKCPRRVAFVDTLPRLDNGKIYKRRLRELFRAPPEQAPDGTGARAPEGAGT